MATAAALSVKLLIDTKSQRVLFAEASKEVFSLLALPVATAVKLLGKDAMVGCISNLYSSVEKLESTYVQTGVATAALLSPTVLSLSSTSLLFQPEKTMTIYRCTGTTFSTCRTYVTCVYGSACPSCRCTMSVAAKLGLPSAGFVQGIVKYMVLDNLTVTPISAISSITFLNAFAGRDMGDLQEKTVQLGYNEVG